MVLNCGQKKIVDPILNVPEQNFQTNCNGVFSLSKSFFRFRDIYGFCHLPYTYKN